MLRSNLKPLQLERRLPATDALERLLTVCHASDAEAVGVKMSNLFSSLPSSSDDDKGLDFPSLSWSSAFPSLGETDDDDADAEADPDNISLCSKDSSSSSCCSLMSLEDQRKPSTKRRVSRSECTSGNTRGLSRSKRLASELCMLRSDSEGPQERSIKRRSI